MVRVYYSDDYVLAAHSFDTTRKARWVSEALRADPAQRHEVVAPDPVTYDDIAALHDQAYVSAVRDGTPRNLAESNGFPWDAGLWSMVCASNGGAVAAALHALESGGTAGSLSSGLHHARRDRGNGFCTFNGIALAARAAVTAGAGRILIIDLDAHCGGGTFDLLASDPTIRQIDLAVSPFDWYGGNDRMQLDFIQDPKDYLPTLRSRLDRQDARSFDLVLYNAGMDPHEGCNVGGRAGIDRALLAQRESMVFEWCRSNDLPTAFVLAGGYTGPRLSRHELVDLHLLTIVAAGGPIV